jgi:hypothetical protein
VERFHVILAFGYAAWLTWARAHGSLPGHLVSEQSELPRLSLSIKDETPLPSSVSLGVISLRFQIQLLAISALQLEAPWLPTCARAKMRSGNNGMTLSADIITSICEFRMPPVVTQGRWASTAASEISAWLNSCYQLRFCHATRYRGNRTTLLLVSSSTAGAEFQAITRL